MRGERKKMGRGWTGDIKGKGEGKTVEVGRGGEDLGRRREGEEGGKGHQQGLVHGTYIDK